MRSLLASIFCRCAHTDLFTMSSVPDRRSWSVTSRTTSRVVALTSVAALDRSTKPLPTMLHNVLLHGWQLVSDELGLLARAFLQESCSLWTGFVKIRSSIPEWRVTRPELQSVRQIREVATLRSCGKRVPRRKGVSARPATAGARSLPQSAFLNPLPVIWLATL
jgi:hypothetical protein